MSHHFSFATVKDFDNHIDKSVRGYSDLIEDVINFSRYFIEDGTKVVDVGCSTGKMLETMAKLNEFTPNSDYIGIECEPNFTDKLEDHDNVSYYKGDVREFKDWRNMSFCTSIFTLQFMPRTAREFVVRDIFNGMNKGGAFVFAEKQYSADPRVQDMMTFVHYGHKRKSFSSEEILDKEESLRSMMHLDLKGNLIGLNGYVARAGFTSCEQIWQNHNFCAYLAIK